MATAHQNRDLITETATGAVRPRVASEVMLLPMFKTPVIASVEPVREEERWARVELPPGGLALHPFEAWTDSPIGPAVIIAAAFSVATLFGRTVIGGQELGHVWFDILNGVIFAYIPAATVILRRGVARDLFELRPTLRCSDAEFEDMLTSACSSSELDP